MAQPQNDPNRLMQQNAAMRGALLATGMRMRKNLGAFTSTTAGTSRVKLFNVGVLTGILLEVSAAITIGTAVGVPSAKAPYNLIQRIRLTDYDGTDRINLTGFQLYILNSVRDRSPFGSNNAAGANAAMVNPNVPTAVGAQTVQFFMYVPVAFDVDNPVIQLQDLRGAIMCQTNVGELYLTIDWIQSLYGNGDVESLYAGGATTTVVGNPVAPGQYITCNVWQDFIVPQAIGAQGQVPLPGIDLMTVYELNGNVRSSDNLAVGIEKLMNYPNVRSVIGTYFNYVSAGAMSQAISSFRLIANGNTILKENSQRSQLFNQRRYIDADLSNGVYWYSHREKPIETALYGNVQLGITPTVVGATPYIEFGTESFYVKGQALPGMPQS